MNATILYKKFILSVLFAGSVVITGGIYQTTEIADTSFMNDNEIQFSKRFDDSRYVASAESELEKPKFAVRYLPKNQKNMQLIAGKWIVTRIEGHDEVEVYNAKNEVREIIVDMELVATSQVLVNNDKKYQFDISFLHESAKTIALFRSYNDGYEILEARRMVPAEIAQEKAVSEIESSDLEKRKSTVQRSEATSEELILERALIPSLDPNIIIFKEESANTASISTRLVESLSVTVEKNGKSISFDELAGAEIGDGGSILLPDDNGDMVPAGLVTNNGKDGLRVRLTKKGYEGVMLSFVTSDEFGRIKDEEREVEELREQNAYENGYDTVEQATTLNVVQTEAASARGEVVEEEELSDEEYDRLSLIHI